MALYDTCSNFSRDQWLNGDTGENLCAQGWLFLGDAWKQQWNNDPHQCHMLLKGGHGSGLQWCLFAWKGKWTHVVLWGPTKAAGFALNALPLIGFYSLSHVCGELQAGRVSWGRLETTVIVKAHLLLPTIKLPALNLGTKHTRTWTDHNMGCN